ncbi:MAG: hypothetical protein IPM54_14700 [Polyangiaceae bacterium]|nr:hypothetical protein [Polyangiaceae bacterium]
MFRNFLPCPRSRGSVVGGLLYLIVAGAGLWGCGDAKGVNGSTTGGNVEPKPEPVPLGLNDVSVLFPLPSSFSDPSLLRPEDVGARGVLLPQEVFDTIPTFPVMPAEGLDYDRMRVVSLRFDGCGGLPEVCKPEIRLVMQPLKGAGGMRDSALHLFYRLDDAAMRQVVDGLRALRSLAPEALVDGPLDVHPALVAQGALGAYGTELRKLVLEHIGDQNLVRVTFFLRAPPTNEVWFFGGFEREEGKMTAMNVVGVGTDPQRVILAKTDTTYEYDLTPLGIKPEDGHIFYSTAAADAATEDGRRATMASYLRVENPTIYVPDHLPCAGCHLSTFVTAEATRRFGIDPATFESDRYASSSRDLTLRGGAGENSSSLRAFGYFGTDPMIVQRTINESAAVIDDLETRYPEQPAK